MQNFIPKIAIFTALALSIAACSDSNTPPETTETHSFSVRVINMTNAQPLSPPVAMLHSNNFNFWSIGEPASVALEVMAEGGDGSALLALQANNPQFIASEAVFPGMDVEFTIETSDASQLYLSVAGMLINTNDAFSGVNSIELDDMVAGQTRVYNTHSYDAGTEFNSELSGSLPGPADGGEGFNADRDDVTSVVTLHGGVVSADDDFADSTLTGADKFDNPTLRIIVTAL